MKKAITILVLAISVSCNQTDKTTKTNIQEAIHSEILNEKETPVNPILDFRQLIKNGEIENAKNVISKYGVNYKDEYDRNFFSTAVRESAEITGYMLDNGYIMNSTDEYQFFDITKSDTSLFSSLYIKHIKDLPSISSAVFHSCDINLLKYYIEKENPDISICSYNLPHMSDFHCWCIINHCEQNSVEILKVLLKYYPNRLPVDKSCIIENWIQDFPKLADSLLIDKLLESNLIPETEEWTPLISYCRWNQNNIVNLLLKNGFNPNWNNSSNLLYYALTRVGDGFGEGITKEIRNKTVELLLEYGANPELKITVNFDGNNSRINFIDFVKNWTFEDNTELLNILNKYAR